MLQKNNYKNFRKILIIKNQIDVITLSSTHLPFLLKLLAKKRISSNKFIDPGNASCKTCKKKIQKAKLNKNKLCNIIHREKSKNFSKTINRKIGI